MIARASKTAQTFAGPIELGERNAATTFFLIHGYTGTPYDFNRLPQYLHDTYGARVRVMLLPGHGTTVRDLDHISYEDFTTAIEEAFAQELAVSRHVIVGGISFGALMALRLATRFPVHGVINVGAPFAFRFPFNLPGLEVVRYYKKYWKKKFSSSEQLLRQGSFYYQEMHVNGLALVKRARREVLRYSSAITCPVITVHSINDPIGSIRGVHRLQSNIRSLHEVIMYDNKNHNIFYSEKRNELYRHIDIFLQQTIESRRASECQRVAAIVPAYNESKRLASVLGVLTRTPEIGEVVVVDDGSTDATVSIAKAYPGVTVLVNNQNRGKSYSLQRGIDHTTADVLFFCDADLKGLTPQIVSEIVRPVTAGYRDMFIGVRNNVSQKALTLFALNSGERALRRELWEIMPSSFKHRYRLEVGLNVTAATRGKGYGWKRFEYYQMLKEIKYGLLRGTLLRWRMSLDVLYAYLLALFYRVIWSSRVG